MAENKTTAKIVVEVVTDGAKKGFDALKKGAAGVGKAVGGVFKAFKSLAIVGAIGGAITGAFSKNQKVVDAFNKVINTVAIIFSEIADAVFGAFDAQSELNGGFDATKKVLGALISGVLNIFLGTIQSIKLGVLVAQRAWEDSFFGDGDQTKIKELTKEINETKEALSQTGDAIVEAGKQIGTNFVEAVGEVANTAIAVIDAVNKKAQSIDLKKATEQADRLLALKKAANLADVERQRIQLEFQNTQEQLRQLRDDDTKSLEVRQQANTDLLASLEAQAKAEKQQLNIKLAYAAANFAISKTDEDLVALKQAQLELTDLDERLQGQKSEALSNQNALLKEQTDIAKANTEANLASLEQSLAANADLQTSESEKLRLTLQNIDIIKAAKLAAVDEELATTAQGTARYSELLNQRALLEQTAAEQTAQTQKDLDQKVLDNKKELQDAIISVTSVGLSAVGDLATLFAGEDEKKQKKAFEINKKLQIADTVMATYQAVVGAMSAKGADGLLPFPLRLANAAIAGVVGAANVAKIKATTFGSESISPATSGASGNTPLDPNAALSGFQPGNNTVGPNQAGQKAEPIRAYVMESEITHAQQANKRITDLARL